MQDRKNDIIGLSLLVALIPVLLSYGGVLSYWKGFSVVYASVFSGYTVATDMPLLRKVRDICLSIAIGTLIFYVSSKI